MAVNQLLNASRAVLAAAVLAASIAAAVPAPASESTPRAGTQVIETRFSFDVLWNRLKQAIKTNGMGIVAQACASCGAKGRGVTIPGNAVVMVFRNDFAVRMLDASVAAGIEAPLRFYLTANADGTAALAFRKPSTTFAPYGSAKLDEVARELDAIWDNIVRDTLKE